MDRFRCFIFDGNEVEKMIKKVKTYYFKYKNIKWNKSMSIECINALSYLEKIMFENEKKYSKKEAELRCEYAKEIFDCINKDIFIVQMPHVYFLWTSFIGDVSNFYDDYDNKLYHGQRFIGMLPQLFFQGYIDLFEQMYDILLSIIEKYGECNQGCINELYLFTKESCPSMMEKFKKSYLICKNNYTKHYYAMLNKNNPIHWELKLDFE